MYKLYKKFLAFLVFIFLLFNTSVVFATNLEVNYPQIAGKTISSSTELPAYALYLFNAGMFIGFFCVFISLIIAGITWIMSAAKPDYVANAKDRITGAISGLLILVCVYLIVITINPQMAAFNLNKLPDTPPPPAEKPNEGVYFYKNSGCDQDSDASGTSDINDLGDKVRNLVNSVKIVHGDQSYVSILYESTNLQGKCLYLDPTKDCDRVPTFGSSAIIRSYDFSPNGDGVYFYRKSYFNDQGGYFKVRNSQINGIYFEPLASLSFTGGGGNCTVPTEEQDCVKFNKDGTCANDGRKCPTLDGENISSVKISGNYLVLFTYVNKNVQDINTDIMDSCQAFPTKDDVNKTGPQQIKWEFIRNHDGVVPNYVTIIPIK